MFFSIKSTNIIYLTDDLITYVFFFVSSELVFDFKTFVTLGLLTTLPVLRFFLDAAVAATAKILKNNLSTSNKKKKNFRFPYFWNSFFLLQHFR